MSIQSMTGFARIEGVSETANWVWEIRSLNGKGLDIRQRIPAGNDNLLQTIRKRISSYFKRGNLQILLEVDRPESQSLPVVNQAALDAVLSAVATIQNKIDTPPPAAEQILRIKGVLETGDGREKTGSNTDLDDALLQDFEKLLEELKNSRIKEGLEISEFLNEQLNQLEHLTQLVSNDPSRSPEQIKKRLQTQLAQLIDSSSDLDSDRIYQEAAILATRSDLAEELDRLQVHIGTARQLLEGEGPSGRKLDFICQEFNRECNTICSKSNAVAVTNAGLDMKVVIDQFREQVQNLE